MDGLKSLSKSKIRCPILDLSGIPLKGLPDCLDRITDLQELYLDQNNLSKLPPSLGHCPKLRLLSLGRNNISKLPDTIKERWHTLEIVYLGQNQFSENPIDEEWMMMFKQGSIGSNPIPEPISPLWMTKQDVKEFPERIQILFHEETPEETSQIFLQQAIHLIQNCPEPMIYERLFKGVKIINLDPITIEWNEWFSSPILQQLGHSIIPFIPRGSLVHSSIINFILTQSQ